MKSMLSVGLAMLGMLSLSAASLMPEKGKISIAGGDGCTFKAQDDHLVISREKPGIQQFMRGMLRFNPALDSNFATFDTLVLELKVPQDITLRTRWRKTDKTMLGVPDTQIKGSAEFQTVAVRLPHAPDRQLESLSLEFFPEQPEILIRKMAIEQPAKVTLEQTGDITKVQKELSLRGVTAEPNSEVVIALKNSRGEIATRTVRSDDKGVYELKWPRPPVNIWYWNSVSAAVNGGKNAADVSLELPVFGYFVADSHIWLKVKGKQIVTSPDAAGGEQPFVPVGIGYARDVIIPAQDEQVMKYCKERNLNTVRLPFYTRFFNNRDTEPLNIDEHIRDFIVPAVQAAKRNNLYVILDDHGYFTSAVDESKAREKQQAARWSEEGVNEWIARWVKVAEYFKDDPTVLGYELLNEPHDISPELTCEWYTRCLKAIRKVDQRHIIIVGNCDWSHARAMDKTWGGDRRHRGCTVQQCRLCFPRLP